MEESQIFYPGGRPGSAEVEQQKRQAKREIVTEDTDIWGLGAISHREPGSAQYAFDDSAGALRPMRRASPRLSRS